MNEFNQNNSQTVGTYTDYNKVLMSIVVDLKNLRTFSQKLQLSKSVQLIDEVLERIEKKTFSVAVVGEFKRGKSTFINALLGQDILPSDILPTTATLNRVTYGIKPFVKILFKDQREEEVAIDQLTNYVTKLTPEGEETASQVKEAIVYYPVHYCQNNVDIIDTPGLNDDANMTEVTLSVLPQVDAAIMVVMAQAPFSEYERVFLETKLLANDLGRIIFVVTGIDRYNNPEDVERGVNYIKERVKKHVLQRALEQYGKDSPEFEVYQKKIGTPKVFGLSAYQALQAKQNDNGTLLAQSRFSTFETALETFLTQERGATFLQVPLNRAIASATEILTTLNIQENALAMKQEDFREAHDKSVTEIEALRTRNAEEMKLIDAACEQVKQRVQPLVWHLENEIKRAAEDKIASTDIRPAELGNKKEVSQKLGHKVSEAVQKAAQNQAAKIQVEIELGLVKEVERLQEFAKSVNQVLQGIEMQFISVEATSTAKKTASGESFAAALAVLTGFGGIWSGYREAGLKGATIGAAGSFGTAFAAGIIAGMIGLPVTFPVMIAVGVLSFFTGGQLAKAVFGGERVESFKANYREAVLAEIDKQLRESRIDQKVNTQIVETFETLKRKVHQEVESLLDNTQNTLTELRAKREREELLTEHEQQELEQMRTQTERILGSAQGLSRQLIQKVNLAETEEKDTEFVTA
jgi:GTPase SAR1 family protein